MVSDERYYEYMGRRLREEEEKESVIKEEHTPEATVLKLYHDNRIFITKHVGGTAIEAQEKAYKHTLTKLL